MHECIQSLKFESFNKTQWQSDISDRMSDLGQARGTV